VATSQLQKQMRVFAASILQTAVSLIPDIFVLLDNEVIQCAARSVKSREVSEYSAELRIIRASAGRLTSWGGGAER
jgi:hypothetical protein